MTPSVGFFFEFEEAGLLMNNFILSVGKMSAYLTQAIKRLDPGPPKFVVAKRIMHELLGITNFFRIASANFHHNDALVR